MAVTRYRDPANLFGLQRLNRILDEAFGGFPFQDQSTITSTWYAPTDVSEDESNLQISMELPGVEPDDVRLSLENSILTIRGEKRQRSEENNERVHRFERTYGMFERTFALPNTVDPEKIEARYENGVLLVRIPKAERARPREIPVNSSSSSSSAQVRSGAQAHKPGQQSGTGNGGAHDAEEEGSAAKRR